MNKEKNIREEFDDYWRDNELFKKIMASAELL